MSEKKYDYLIILDFEATCFDINDKHTKPDHEIIEFPSVVVDIKAGKIVDKIEQFVKPKKNIELSLFCKNLTSITQSQVDGGIPLRDALKFHHKFVSNYQNSILVFCGDWDGFMLQKDAQFNNLDVPTFYKKWINIKIPFQKIYNLDKSYCKNIGSMNGMLKYLNMEFEGTPHRGICDCSNLANICIKMLSDGWEPRVTYQI